MHSFDQMGNADPCAKVILLPVIKLLKIFTHEFQTKNSLNVYLVNLNFWFLSQWFWYING